MLSAEIQNDPRSDRILVLGATGLLGAILYKEFKNSQVTFGTHFKSPRQGDDGLHQVDASDTDQLKKIIHRFSPTRIVNCIGLTSVEECERRPEASWKINTEVPLRLAQICQSLGIQFIQISTDHFSSIQSLPRSESEVLYPINQYGLSKFQAESAIRSYNSDALILRTNFFGHTIGKSKSLLDFALQALSSQKKVLGFADVHFSPVRAVEIARFILDSRSKSITGLLNFSSKEVVTKFEFLKMVAEIKGFNPSSVCQTSILDSELRVNRPNYLALDSTYLTNVVGYEIPSLEEMLRVELESFS